MKQSEYVAFTDPGARGASDLEEASRLEDETGAPEIKVWSNPTKSKMNVVVTSPRTAPVDLQVITLNGKSMLQKNIATNQESEVDITAFPKGMYLLRAAVGLHVKTIKVIKE